ncbi:MULTISPECIES: hypothetical protein [Stenotrophomonas]|nr:MULTISPECIES: hypothetical protein [Stenotrophomonas]
MQLDGLKLHQLYAVRRHWARLGDAAKVVQVEAAIDERIALIGGAK